jgi:hypothetical protein
MLSATRGRRRIAALTELLGRFPIAIVQCMFRLAIALPERLGRASHQGVDLIFLLTHGAGPWSLDRLVGLESEETGRE